MIFLQFIGFSLNKHSIDIWNINTLGQCPNLISFFVLFFVLFFKDIQHSGTKGSIKKFP